MYCITPYKCLWNVTKLVTIKWNEILHIYRVDNSEGIVKNTKPSFRLIWWCSLVFTGFCTDRKFCNIILTNNTVWIHYESVDVFVTVVLNLNLCTCIMIEKKDCFRIMSALYNYSVYEISFSHIHTYKIPYRPILRKVHGYLQVKSGKLW